MANFEAFHWNFSSSINLFFPKSDIIAGMHAGFALPAAFILGLGGLQVV